MQCVSYNATGLGGGQRDIGTSNKNATKCTLWPHQQGGTRLLGGHGKGKQ